VRATTITDCPVDEIAPPFSSALFEEKFALAMLTSANESMLIAPPSMA